MIVILFVSISGISQSSSEKFTVIGNSITMNAMSLSELKDIFLGEKQVDPSNNTIVVVLPTTDFQGAEEVARLISGSSLNSFRRYWLSIVFQGRANPPIYFNSNQMMIDFVRENPSSIAILYDYTGSQNITTIQINSFEKE
ncbi:MAG: hypothetical protein P8O07_03980 [Crocinitomicaceae bacterium]|nr:hypothetical protein [Crocinitomicaceae bacterium]